MLTEEQIRKDIVTLKRTWFQRNAKFDDWYEILLLIDQLKAKNLESTVSNAPQTFYNMASYLLTKGELSHTTPITSESALELDRKAKVDRACRYMWGQIDLSRQLGGDPPYIDELAFYLLVLGWYATVVMFDNDTGKLQTQIWNPANTYPRYANGRLAACVHSYKITEEEALIKAEENGWSYGQLRTASGEITLDDYFVFDPTPHNIILFDGRPVTSWEERPEMQVLVSPVGGFPDKGSLATRQGLKWRGRVGRSIFEVNEEVIASFNKWKTMISQMLRDTSQSAVQEFSASPQATPEQMRERGAVFHYAPGEQGLQRVGPAALPMELQSSLFDIQAELQKGSFSNAVFGMMEGQQAGYALSLLATSSANQILFPYMDAKHFVISVCDKFWLSNLKDSKKTFKVKGRLVEELETEDIPEDVELMVESEVATPKDWMERGTIANMMKEHLDEATIITEILKMSDPQAIKRRKSLDRVLEHPMSQQIEMIAAYYAHADYLEASGDIRQAGLFRKAAQSLEAQMGAPPPGQGRPEDMTRIMAEREAGAPDEVTKVSPEIAPPETRGFAPGQLRQIVGQGTLR